MQGVFVVGGGGGGSMSTVDNAGSGGAMSSEDSSSSDEGELELGLGLSLGGGGGPYARIFTAKDLPSLVLSTSSTTTTSATSSSSSSSTLINRGNYSATAGTKRCAADSSQVVGWPPIRAYRMNSMVNQAKSLATEEFNSVIGENESNNNLVEKRNNGSNMNTNHSKVKATLFVKVNMDGIPIGRKVDLNAQGCYETLAQTLEDMFLRPTSTINAIRSSAAEHNMVADAARCPKLLDSSSDFALTYEDKEGDWMLVGDVPWGMFLSSVRRLRIMRTSEATGLGPMLQERNGRQRAKPI